jgi:DHA1 family tetracycline resistance protein-like MFS transporter
MRFDNRAIPIVLAVVLIDSMGFGIVLPVLPDLIVHLGKVSVEQATRIAGYMLVAYATAQFFAGPIMGNLGDHFGRRPVLLLCMIAFGIDYGLMAIAPTLAWLFLGRTIAGIAGATFGPANAVIADVTPPEKRGATFGLIGAAFGIGFILGPAIGGLLSGLGTRTPFIAAAALAALNAVVMLLLLPETLPPARRRPFSLRDAHIFSAFRPLLHAGGAAPLLVAAFLWLLAHSVYPATWAFWARLALHWDAGAIGWSLATTGIAMAVTQTFVIGRAIARFGEARTAVFGAVIGTLTFLGYALAPIPWFVYVLLIVGALQALTWPSMNALLSQMTDASHQGALQGGMAAISSLSSIIAPLLLTQTLAFGAERGFPGGAFLLAAFLAAFALLILLIGVVPKVRRAEQPASAF